jgi:transcriptional antiterminator NusG
MSLSFPHLSIARPPACGTGMQSDEAFWFAVQTRPRHEKRVSQSLKEKGVPCFLPLHREKRQWSDRWQWVEWPLFAHYVFVRIAGTPELRVSVLRTNGVIQFVGASFHGTPIPDDQIENLRTLTDQRVLLSPHEFLRIGERVRIRGGALNGIEGVLAAVKNDRTLVVSVDLIQKSVSIRIEGFEVERVNSI